MNSVLLGGGGGGGVEIGSPSMTPCVNNGKDRQWSLIM